MKSLRGCVFSEVGGQAAPEESPMFQNYAVRKPAEKPQNPQAKCSKAAIPASAAFRALGFVIDGLR